jgi:hypothetical protein
MDREPLFTTLRVGVALLRKAAMLRDLEVFDEPALGRLRVSDEY